MNKRNIALTMLIAISSPLNADIVDGMLTVAPGSNTEVNFEIIGFGSDSETVDYTGTANGQIDIDPESGAISSFKLDKATTFSSDLDLSIDIGMGFQFDILFHNLRNTTTSNGIFVPVSESGGIAAGSFTSQVDRGSVSLTSNVPDAPAQVIDFTAMPQDFLQDSEGDTLTSRLVSEDAFSRRWEITFINVVNANKQESESGITIRFSEIGSLTSRGFVETSTSYGKWLQENGFGELPFEGANPRSNIANGILFALDILPAPTSELPLSPDPSVAGGWILQLPEGGTAAQVTIEKSGDLTPSSWIPLESSETSTSSATIAKGSTGTVQFHTTENSQFFRLSSSL